MTTMNGKNHPSTIYELNRKHIQHETAQSLNDRQSRRSEEQHNT